MPIFGADFQHERTEAKGSLLSAMQRTCRSAKWRGNPAGGRIRLVAPKTILNAKGGYGGQAVESPMQERFSKVGGIAVRIGRGLPGRSPYPRTTIDLPKVRVDAQSAVLAL